MIRRSKRSIAGALALAATFLSAGSALAEGHTKVGWVSVFDGGESPKTGKAEVAQVEKFCNFHMMSRMGPDPRELAACNAAVSRLNARGPAVVPAILAALDREATTYAARERLYGALAQTGDVVLAAKMIDGMAKVAQSRVDPRTYEASQMEEVAQTILRVAPAEKAPWVQQTVRDPYAQITDRVIAWRVHQRDTAGKSLDEVAAARLAKARAEKNDPDAQKAYLAVRHLIEVDAVEGLAAAEVLVARLPVIEGTRDPVRTNMESLRRIAEYKQRERQAEAEARAKAAKPNKPFASKKAVPVQVSDSKARS